jgi:hypothetical protein
MVYFQPGGVLFWVIRVGPKPSGPNTLTVNETLYPDREAIRKQKDTYDFSLV